MGVEKDVITAAPEGAQKPAAGNTVTVHCTGYGKDRDMNLKFWSTKDPGQQPFTFQIGMGQVIKAWDEGVMGMALGEKAMLKATADYAYGAGGFPAWGIQPDSPLNFEVEVLEIKQ
jgi:peptidylprolyl isomerase